MSQHNILYLCSTLPALHVQHQQEPAPHSTKLSQGMKDCWSLWTIEPAQTVHCAWDTGSFNPCNERLMPKQHRKNLDSSPSTTSRETGQKGYLSMHLFLTRYQTSLSNSGYLAACRYKRRLHALWTYLRGSDDEQAVPKLQQKVLSGESSFPLHCRDLDARFP